MDTFVKSDSSQSSRINESFTDDKGHETRQSSQLANTQPSAELVVAAKVETIHESKALEEESQNEEEESSTENYESPKLDATVSTTLIADDLYTTPSQLGSTGGAGGNAENNAFSNPYQLIEPEYELTLNQQQQQLPHQSTIPEHAQLYNLPQTPAVAPPVASLSSESKQEYVEPVQQILDGFNAQNGVDGKCDAEKPKFNLKSRLSRVRNLCDFKFDFKLQLKKQFRDNLLLFMTVMAVVAGVIAGFVIRENVEMKPPVRAYFGFPGEIFLRMLKFLILPLMGSSLISGIAGLNRAKTGQIASRAFCYYFSTTLMAALLGLVLVISINPGRRVKFEETSITNSETINGRKINPLDTMLDLLRNLFPDNMIQLAFTQYESKIVPKYKLVERPLRNLTFSDSEGQMRNTSTEAYIIISPNNSFNLDISRPLNVSTAKNYEKEFDYWQVLPSERMGLNVLGLVMFCLTFGYVISSMGESGRILVNFFEAVNEASIRMISIVMFFSPLGIASLICVTILNMEDPEAMFSRIGFYMLTVLLGLFIHGCIVLPLIYLVITRRNVFVFAKNMLEALLVAVATSSSNATLPVTFKCIEEKNKIPKMVSRFVLPIGATINMDGTALYEAIAAIFIAQVNNLDLKIVDYIVTSLTATVASIGAAGVPSAGLVTMVMVLSALNLPASQISLIYAVDWFLDRFRTVINVFGDSIGAGIVAHLSIDEDEDNVFAAKPKVDETSPPAFRGNSYQVNNAHVQSNSMAVSNDEYITQRYSSAIIKINESYLDDQKNGETTF